MFKYCTLLYIRGTAVRAMLMGLLTLSWTKCKRLTRVQLHIYQSTPSFIGKRVVGGLIAVHIARSKADSHRPCGRGVRTTSKGLQLGE